jgi:hypothetical protein
MTSNIRVRVASILNERSMLLEATLITVMVVAIGLAFNISSWWYPFAALAAALTLWVYRDSWLEFIQIMWEPENRLVAYTLIGVIFGATLIVIIWSFLTLMTVIGVIIFSALILWMINSNSEYKRSQRY